MKLTYLNLWGNSVADLTPLRGMPLQSIDLSTEQRAMDLSALADCRELEEITLPRWFYHEEALRSLPKLRRARLYPVQNFTLPIKQFWAELKPEWVNSAHARAIIQFSGLKMSAFNPVSLDPDGTLMIDLNHADGGPIPSLAGLPVSRLNADASTFTDLSPLHGLPLRRLSLNGSPVGDLTPLAGSPLQSLSVNNTKVKDLSPLRGVPLQEIYLSNLGSPISLPARPPAAPAGYRQQSGDGHQHPGRHAAGVAGGQRHRRVRHYPPARNALEVSLAQPDAGCAISDRCAECR